MKMEIGVPVSSLDLAQATSGDQGTFLCQQGGQNFLLVAAEGHSIKYGPRPVGRRVQEVISSNGSPEAWTITKISDSDISQGFNYQGQQNTQQRHQP